jgi:hypothetical protein
MEDLYAYTHFGDRGAEVVSLVQAVAGIHSLTHSGERAKKESVRERERAREKD